MSVFEVISLLESSWKTMNNANFCLSFYWNRPFIFIYNFFLIRSELQLHLIWNYFVSVKLPVLTSGKNFPPCKWAAQVSLRLCDLQHKTHIKICIPEEIKNLGKPSPAAPALSPDHALSPWKQTESKELSAQVNLNWSRHSECENSTWNGQWVSEQRELWAQLQRKNRETGNIKSFANRVSSLWVGLCWRGWTCFTYKTTSLCCGSRDWTQLLWPFQCMWPAMKILH